MADELRTSLAGKKDYYRFSRMKDVFSIYTEIIKLPSDYAKVIDFGESFVYTGNESLREDKQTALTVK